LAKNEKKSYSENFRQAKLKYLEECKTMNKNKALPYYWQPFTIYSKYTD
jgi:hypothetical protein